jgi:uncharacterized iron-regulated membrane protein
VRPYLRLLARWTFHVHLWVGVVVGALLLVVSLTGVLLNHKLGLGLMPEVEHVPTAPLGSALPLAELVGAAAGHAGAEVAAAGVDRMDVRPDDGLVKVRFRDRRVTEVTVDLATGRALDIGERNDVFLEKLHSGEIFGSRWVLLSDLAAVAAMLLVGSGLVLWLVPKAKL